MYNKSPELQRSSAIVNIRPVLNTSEHVLSHTLTANPQHCGYMHMHVCGALINYRCYDSTCSDDFESDNEADDETNPLSTDDLKARAMRTVSCVV